MTSVAARLCCLALGAALGLDAARAAPPENLSSVAKGVYAAARPRLLQIRTLLGSTERQSSIGSGFLVSANGFAITN